MASHRVAGRTGLTPHVYIWLLQNQKSENGTKIEVVMSIMRNSSMWWKNRR